MAGPKVHFKLTTKANGKFTCPEVQYSPATAEKFKPPYADGQIIFVEDEGQIFLDFHNWRKCYSASAEDRKESMRYLGISTTDPTTGTVTVDGKVVEPKANDMVVFGTKEYMYRNGSNGLTWYEIGDEEAPSWNENDNSWSVSDENG